ncbi:MAG: hypothetical protein K0R39_923 [Symbiobacteriaceae bacterium]|nr:hypothetical protein [Symbiobacteriaceae bacterium]
MVWQKFTETVLREDGARFAIETTGAPDAPLSAWIASAVQMLKYHHMVLACEWEEKTLPVTAGRPVQGWTPPWPAPGQPLDRYAADRAEAFRRHASALYVAAGVAQARRRAGELPAFLEQISVQRILEPLPYLDRRVPVASADLRVAVTVGGQYYVLPLSEPMPTFPAPDQGSSTVRPAAEAQSPDRALAAAPRGRQARLRRLLPPEARAALAELRQAPILINWDLHDGTLPLGELRRLARRGCNDHPLVLIRTTTGMIFDFSHVVFDAMWAIQIAELMTRVAAAPVPAPAPEQPTPLSLTAGPEFYRTARPGAGEVSAETTDIALPPILNLARRAGCTVNDILVLARWAYALERGEAPPALLVPLDMFPVDPSKRLRLAVIRPDQAPPSLLRQPWPGPAPAQDPGTALQALNRTLSETYAATKQGETFACLAQQVMVLTPPPLRAPGNWATEQLAWTRDRIKGREVFSNLGRLPAGATTTRFVSARGLGGAHDRVWGIMTTVRGELYVSMRDFRPGGQHPAVARAYVDGYAMFTNRLVHQLVEMLQ